jgi:hypothetical protein
LQHFGEDLPGTKSLLHIAHNLLDEIPTSQWDEILHGESIDLNQIFASMHFIHLIIKRERVAWATLKSSLQFPKQNAKSKLVLNGQPPFKDCQKQSPFFSPTGKVNLEIIPSISRVSLLPNKPGPMEKSSFLTNQSEIKLGEEKTFYSWISKGSKILVKPFCIPTELNIAKEDQADLGELT